MGQGGGCKVAVKMAEAMIESGFEVGFTAFRGYPKQDLEHFHNAKLEGKAREFYMFTVQQERNNIKQRVPIDIFPMWPAILLFSPYLKSIIKKYEPDVLCFHDDVPPFISKRQTRAFALLYAHFPISVRLKLNINEEWEIEGIHTWETKKTSIKHYLAEFLDYPSRLINVNFVNDFDPDLIIANSSITNYYLHCIINKDSIILHPPVDTQAFRPSKKRNLIVSIGVLRPNKRFGDIITALSNIKSECKGVIIGHLHSYKYYLYLRHLIRSLNAERKIEIIVNAENQTIRRILSEAKAIVSASRFEPFGISTVEGMAAGCIPIVYRGNNSGPWIDVIDKGKFGLGFETIDELKEKIESVINDEYKKYSEKIMERARIFDTSTFKMKFINILKEAEVI
jgi:glycosyltransferase involved in cell wall biosynthesis